MRSVRDARLQETGRRARVRPFDLSGWRIRPAEPNAGPFPALQVPFDDFEEKEAPARHIPLGPFRGLLEPTRDQARVSSIMSGPGPSGGGNEPVSFGIYSPTGKLISTGYYPPDVSGAVAGTVVLIRRT